ncbi:hypothetical protein KKF84_02870, partial [Myxococcota bacterium]|nr:hypothetical protein [Myxococcota bacterium]MBU1534232.1 hypothetical protein [Myxococcota bacterium]
MNSFTIIPMITLLVNVFATSYVIAKNPDSPVNRAYVYWSMAVSLWLFCEVFMYGPVSLEEAVLLGKISSIGWLSVGFLFLNFTYRLIERPKDLLLYGYSVIVIVVCLISLFTDLVIRGAAHYYWGNNIIGGVFYIWAVNGLVALPIALAIGLLFVDYRRSSEGRFRGHLPVAFSGLIMLLFGFTSDVIIPEVFGIRNMISLAPNLTVIVSLVIVMAIRRLGIMIDVAYLAQELLANVTDGILVVSERGRVAIANEAAHKILGVENVRGTLLKDLIEKYHPAEVREEVEVFIKGNDLPVTFSQSPIKQWGGISGFVVILRDMSKRLKLESEMVKRQKLESVSVLAGGIAHDFNNVLTSLAGSISLSKSMIPRDNPAYDVLSRAEDATLNSKHLTRQLVTFARGGEPVKKPISVVPLVKSAVHFALSGSNVTYSFTFPENLRGVMGDDGQLRQVVSNLVINAMEAMPGGGVLEIEAANLELRKTQRDLPKGHYIFVSFKDHGSGIEVENLNRIFDPYFTTKGQGTGLGLYSAYSIVKKHGGIIRVSSEPNQGSEFTMLLPAGKSPEQIQRVKTLIPANRGGRVLFMDDEELIFQTTGKLLENSGYSMAYAPDGERAITLYFEAIAQGRPFDLLIMDLTIQGGMGG